MAAANSILESDRPSITDSETFSNPFTSFKSQVKIDLPPDNSQQPVNVQQTLDGIQVRIVDLVKEVWSNTTFKLKYDMNGPRKGKPFLYALTTFSSPYRYTLEVFPRIEKPNQEALTKGPEAFTFHEHFESVIERYTGSRKKPNPALQKTRSTDFCYPLTIHIEAVPLEKARKPLRLLLKREFEILLTLWEKYREEHKQKKCTLDQLVGFPMPFEFCSVTGTDMDLPDKLFENYTYYDISGNLVNLTSTFSLPLAECTTLKSTMSYMTIEKLGPSVSYLLDLVKSQNRNFSLATALMIYDQLLCRLVVMHKYCVIHGDLNTDCLRFGSGNARNVLYISDFSTGLVAPSKFSPNFLFHDRFVSVRRVKDKVFHFIQDLESAYYIFLLLAIGHLPWDIKVKIDPRHTQPLKIGLAGARDPNPVSDMSTTQKDKEVFWEGPAIIHRLMGAREFEPVGPLYRNFIEDMLVTIYLKMKDTLQNCARISQEVFMRDINANGTEANNAYLGLRKSIASYFQFETLNPFLKDATVDTKIGLLLRANETDDRRAAWDLSSWCWNSICVEAKQKMGNSASVSFSTKTMHLSA